MTRSKMASLLLLDLILYKRMYYFPWGKPTPLPRSLSCSINKKYFLSQSYINLAKMTKAFTEALPEIALFWHQVLRK